MAYILAGMHDPKVIESPRASEALIKAFRDQRPPQAQDKARKIERPVAPLGGVLAEE